jgi:hypothetical protein
MFGSCSFCRSRGFGLVRRQHDDLCAAGRDAGEPPRSRPILEHYDASACDRRRENSFINAGRHPMQLN